MTDTPSETGGPGALVLGPIYREDVAFERARFLDAAALAALPVAVKYWNDLRGSRAWPDVIRNAADDAYHYASAMLESRDRRRAEGKP